MGLNIYAASNADFSVSNRLNTKPPTVKTVKIPAGLYSLNITAELNSTTLICEKKSLIIQHKFRELPVHIINLGPSIFNFSENPIAQNFTKKFDFDLILDQILGNHTFEANGFYYDNFKYHLIITVFSVVFIELGCRKIRSYVTKSRIIAA